MAVINVDDIYTLDNTGKQVDDAVDYALYNSNRNLLDNWYFVGGGSQLGNGIFPINQRGQTSYTAQKSFDRWIVDGHVTVTLQSGNIRVQATAAYVGLYQAIPMSRLKHGETYTFSMIIDGNMVTQTFVLNADGNWNGIYYGDDWYTPYICANGICQFKIINSRGSFDHTIEAVKLEKGTASTLANDVPPDFWEELEKCQHYLWVASFPSGSILSTGYASGSFFITDIILPTTIRESDLTLTFTSNANIIGNGTTVVAASVAGVTRHGNHLRTYITPASALTGQNLYALVTSTDTVMVVSAEL